MRTKDHLEVLVVGAGPVGMFCAVRLAERGIHVKVIDKDCGPASRSYACALHAQTLQLLDEIGLIPQLLERGIRIERVAFYEGHDREAEVNLSVLPVEFPFVLVLPQAELEALLEKRLRELQFAQLDWNCRLAEAKTGHRFASATIDQLGGTGIGYSVPEWEIVVNNTFHLSADFIVGADGAKSQVRRSLAIDYEQRAAPELFSVYQFEASGPADDETPEMRVVFCEDTANVLWPLPDHKFRWSFQIGPEAAPTDFPEKERHPFIIHEEASPDDHRHQLLEILERRAPWFGREIQEIEWSAEVQFEHRLARQFGRDRCWLAGDAAHQTGPIGMQSMNVGIREADKLAKRIAAVLCEGCSTDLLTGYGNEARAQWEELLSPEMAAAKPRSSGSWIQKHAAIIRECMPASGEDLRVFLSDVGLAALPVEASCV